MTDRLLFAHIPKCAGSTLTRILIKYSNPTKILQIQPQTHKTQIAEYLALPRSEQEKYDLILGEHAYKIRDQIPGKLSCITLLRDPISRVVSFYYFVLGRQNHKLHDQLVSSGMGLTDFLSSGMSPEIENQMTLIISRLSRKKMKKDPQFVLEKAINNLENDFLHVGLVEHFDTSLILLKNKLEWDMTPYYLKENVKKLNSSNREPVDPKAGEIIREKNQLDQKLFEYVSQRFFNEIDAQGELLMAEIADFKEVNRKFIARNSPKQKIRQQLADLKKKLLRK